MADCPCCWDVLCSCGYEYRNWSYKERMRLAAAALGVPLEMLEVEIGDKVPDDHPGKGSSSENYYEVWPAEDRKVWKDGTD